MTAVIFAIALAGTFLGWFASERTPSIHSIVTTRRETLYWLTVLFTFALGTAAGDLLAESLNLGYSLSLGLFAAAVVVVGLLLSIRQPRQRRACEAGLANDTLLADGRDAELAVAP